MAHLLVIYWSPFSRGSALIITDFFILLSYTNLLNYRFEKPIARLMINFIKTFKYNIRRFFVFNHSSVYLCESVAE